MATSGTYYLNGPNLATSTAVFLDAAFTTCAPDGYYSDGTIVRQQVSCVLLPQVECPACASACNDLISVQSSGASRLYRINTNSTNALGAIVVEFNFTNTPLGILAELGGTFYNGMSSQFYGWLQGVGGDETYIGQSSLNCGIGGISVTTSEFEYQNGSFQPVGTTIVNTIPGQLALTTNNPGVCKMVIPKPSNNYTIVSTELYDLCGGTDFSVTINCPIQLPTWTGTVNSPSGVLACISVPNQTYYYVHLNGSGGVLGLYDMVFSDPNGEFPLPAGFYGTGAMSPSYDWVEVDSNGVVIAIGTCPTPQGYLIQRCYTATQGVIYVSGSLTVGDRVFVDEYPGCIFEVLNTSTAPQTLTFNSVTSSVCTDQCASWEFTNPGPSPVFVNYIDCNGVSDTFQVIPGDTPIICAREIISAPAPLTYDIVNCNCVPQGKYLVQLCGDPTEQRIVLTTIPITVGQLVKISYPFFVDCWYEVMSTSSLPAMATVVATNSGAFTCSSVCNEYTVTNTTGTTQTLTYTDCSGVVITGLIFNGTSTTFCAQAGTVNAGAMTVTLNSCNC